MITETEINFYRHYNWECLTLEAGKLKVITWLKEHEISSLEFTKFYYGWLQSGKRAILMEDMFEEPPMEYPWKDADEFWSRVQQESGSES